jgi:2-polyprenyl-6-methoxyphenol hydroxylase-like FAD-dependent oxidoreductase
MKRGPCWTYYDDQTEEIVSRLFAKDIDASATGSGSDSSGCGLGGLPTSHNLRYRNQMTHESDPDTATPVANDCEVLIIGGGPVGLTGALCLSQLGVTSHVIERDPSTTTAPKARAVNTRSMEVFRQLGLEEAICREALPLESWRFLFCDEIAGREWARVEDPVDVSAHVSPTWRRTVMQSHVEAVLAEAVLASPHARISFGSTLTALVQDDDGVTATVRDEETGQTRELRARYLIGADGTQSSVRPMLGIELPGETGLARSSTIHHRTDLSPWLADRPCTLAMTAKPGGPMASTGVAKGLEEWVTMVTLSDEPGQRFEDLDEARCIEIVRSVVGVPDLDVEILHVGSFTINFQLAASFRKGRVFLAGDAAHRIPPTGGFGMNLGVQGVHNLCWKLAASLHGASGDALLDSYDVERRASAERVGGWSQQNIPRIVALLSARVNDDADQIQAASTEMEKYVRNIGMDLGTIYASDALIADGLSQESDDPSRYLPSSAPGGRAPHCWLEGEKGSLSTLDLFGAGFVLLADEAGKAWVEVGEKLASDLEAELGIGLQAYRVGADAELRDPDGGFRSAYALPRGGAVLVRPDGHVAWRSANGDAPAKALLESTLRSILAAPERH